MYFKKLAIDTAERNGSKFIIANDPDAGVFLFDILPVLMYVDRLAMAERKPCGEWHIFTGNEIGILLGHWVYTQYVNKHSDADKSILVTLNLF